MDCCLDKGTILNAVYEITDILGMGGYGITYKVIDRNTDRILAVKEYFPAHMVCRDPQNDDVVLYDESLKIQYRKNIEGFLAEARNMARFNNHPNITHVYEFFEMNNTAYYVMEYIDGTSLKEAAADSDKIIADSACNVKDSKSYTYFSWTVFREGTEFKPVLSYDNDISLLYFVTGDEIDEMETGFKERLNKKIPQLDTGSVAVYGTEKFNGDIINLLGKEFKVAAAEKTAVSKDSYMSSMYSGVYYVVVDSKATLAEIFNLNSSLGEGSVPTMLNNEIDYNLYGSSEDKLAVAKALDKHFEENSVKSDVSGFYEESRDANREQIYVLYGGLFFIGIFLGTMFLMVTVMIIFYKQISEGYDDKARYEIMEKVGMSNDEVKKSITSQVRMVFFLPIILAACHLAAAFPLLRRLLVMFNLTDIKLIAICMSATFLVFVAIYYIVFKITSRAYYRIVGNQI